jgi:hypothetical protein
LGPADAGDSLNTPVKTCFTGWGNSCLVEWPWHANRDTQAKQTVWHNYTGKCYENMSAACPTWVSPGGEARRRIARASVPWT